MTAGATTIKSSSRGYLAARRLAFLAWRAGFTDSAQAITRIYTRLCPRDADGWSLRAELEGEFGNQEDTERVLREGLERNQSSLDLRVGLAMHLAGRSRRSEAASLIEEGIGLFGRKPALLLVKASLARDEGDLDKAREYAKEAETQLDYLFDPDTGMALAALLVDMPGEEQHLETVLRTIIYERVENGWIFLMLGVLLEWRGDPESKEYLQDAKKMWGGPAHTFEDNLAFLRQVFAARAASCDPRGGFG